MFARLLIANRGEIAVRVARTARRMGIETVAVYSDPDATALHVRHADLAVALGGSSPAESYLRIDAVVAAARRTGCDALHPGYGFLAENDELARSVIDAGIAWVGPTPEQMALLGNKLAAKRAAAAAGVPSPAPVEIGDDGEIDAAGLDYPVLVKAAAGGGGRGMRVVHARGELAGAIDAARREATSAFGDGALFVEPYVPRGRHVEVQIIGDRHGNVVHLGERECSIQRRNQKLIEEAPSLGIDDETRSRLHAGAVALARHVAYENAGTVEFLVDGTGAAHFLEVNARLQVEHPVTEMTTGLDIVELQLRVAAGEPLPFTQDDVTLRGHAIEARVVAEDPAAGWLPSVGVVTRFDAPDAVRVDSGIEAGGVISPDYDSLVAKFITHGATRADAAQSLAAGLGRTALHGPATNIAALVAILGEPAFGVGETYTTYLDEHPDVLDPHDDRWVFHMIAAVAAQERASRKSDAQWGFAPSGWRNVPTQPQRRTFRRDGGGEVAVDYTVGPDGRSMTVRIGDAEHAVRRAHRDSEEVLVEVDGVTTTVQVCTTGGTIWTNALGAQHRFEPIDRFVDHHGDYVGSAPLAPLPGTIVAVNVAAGDEVADGDTLVVLEAMKMEHRILATAAAVVDRVHIAVGDRVDAGQVLVSFTTGEDHDG